MGFVVMIVGLMLVWIGYTGNQSAIWAVVTGTKPADTPATYNPFTLLPPPFNLLNTTNQTSATPRQVAA